MRTIALIRADFMKQRHTPYFCIHSVIPVTGAILTSCIIKMWMN